MKLVRHFRSRDLILLYHRVARVDSDPWSLCVTPEHFSEHLEVLRKHRPIRLDQVKPSGWRAGGSRASVAITFDDGYADNLYEAKRLLERYDIPATFFSLLFVRSMKAKQTGTVTAIMTARSLGFSHTPPRTPDSRS